MNSFVKIKNLTKFYPSAKGEFEIFSNLSFDLAEGEIVSIIGPSGCGKSTFLRILAGIEKANSGTIEFLSRPSDDIPIVFQKPALLPWRKLISNISLSLELNGCTSEAEVIDIAKVFGLEKFLNFYPKDISSGMQSRVSLARALISCKDFMLIDEAFSTLDEISKYKILTYMSKYFVEKKVSSIIISHNLDDAIFLSDRILICSDRPMRLLEQIVVDIPKPRETNISVIEKINEYTTLVRKYIHSSWSP